MGAHGRVTKEAAWRVIGKAVSTLLQSNGDAISGLQRCRDVNIYLKGACLSHGGMIHPMPMGEFGLSRPYTVCK